MGEQDITDLQPDNRTEVEKQLDSIAVRRKIVPNPHFQEPTLTQMVLHEPEKNATDEPEVIQEQRESILTMGSKLLDKSGKRKRGLLNRLVAGTIGAGLGTMVHLVRTGTIQKWIGGPHAEFFKKQQDVKNQGEDITQDLVMQEQKEGVDFGENFKMNDAKKEGAGFVERTYQDMIRLFDSDNTASKVDPALVKLIIQNPLVFETNGDRPTGSSLIFNQQDWSIAQKLYMESLAIAVQEKGINPNNGGLEQWLVANKKDSVYSLKIDGQIVNISGAHLLQILWNEYRSTDNLPISAQDQQLFLQYWQATGRRWISKIEQGHKLSWSEVQQIFDMAEKTGVDPAEVLGNVFTLREEIVSSQGSVETKALDMAQATMGVTSVDNITGAVLGLMVVFGLGRPRLSSLMNVAGMNIDQARQFVSREGQRILEKLKAGSGGGEELRRLENSRRLVNRLRHGLSLSREVVLDLGAVLLNPDNQDMRDLILTEGPNWFRHVPENHPEIRQIIGFFNCQTYQGLQNLARRPELISPRLEQLLTLKFKEFNERGAGRERGMKLKTRRILSENSRKLIELYQASAGE